MVAQQHYCTEAVGATLSLRVISREAMLSFRVVSPEASERGRTTQVPTQYAMSQVRWRVGDHPDLVKIFAFITRLTDEAFIARLHSLDHGQICFFCTSVNALTPECTHLSIVLASMESRPRCRVV